MSVVVEFKPSAIDLAAAFRPVTPTFDDIRADASAIMLVRDRQLSGDEWRAFVPSESARWALEIGRTEPVRSICRDRRWKPELGRLFDGGYLAWLTESGNRLHFQFTAAGFDRLQSWMRR